MFKKKGFLMMKKNIISIGLLIVAIAVIPLLALMVSPAKSSDTTIKPVVSETSSTTPTTPSKTNINTNTTDSFRIYDKALQEVITVNDFDFCIGAIAVETDTDIPKEALKAEIVALHTYYACLRQQSRQQNKDFDFECNSKTWKVYVGKNQLKEKLRDTFEDYYNTLESAVKEVSNFLIFYDGKLCMTPCFDISVGNTFSYGEIYNENIPYLRSVPSPFDKIANNYTTQLTLSFDELHKIMSEKFSDYQSAENHSDNLKDISESENGAVLKMTVGNHTLSGKEFADIVHLRSNAFTVDFRNNQYQFTVYGYGDNIGLSKFGACKLAEQGYDFQAILHYYYTDITILEK